MVKKMGEEINKLIHEDVSRKNDCSFCKESSYEIGKKTLYGSVIVYKTGASNNGWFATISPKTGGEQKTDFTVQLMPLVHLTHFSQMKEHPKLAENFGTAFAKITAAVAEIMTEEPEIKAVAENRENGAAIAAYGKCTTWKEKKEHLHIKIFQFRNALGQPATVDSSFERKKIEIDPNTGEEFVRMMPVKKKIIENDRLEYLANKLIRLLK
jgi:hypothetical protein